MRRSVTLSAIGQPDGVSATFDPAILSGDASTSVLTLAANATAASGQFSVIVRAEGDGIEAKADTIGVTVQVRGSYSLTATPALVNVPRTSSAATTITVARTGGFAQDVSVAVTGLPSGVTAGLTPAVVNSTGTSTASLVLSASTSAALGTSTVTVTGSSPGLPAVTTTVDVNVTIPPGTTAVQLQFCATQPPAWVGYRNANADWAQATVGSDGSVTIFATDKLVLANTMLSVTAAPGGGQAPRATTSILFVTLGELQQVQGKLCTDERGNAQDVHGTVAGVGSNDLAKVGIRQPWATITQSTAPNYTVPAIPAGTLDLVALRGALPLQSPSPPWAPDRIVIRRGLTFPPASPLPVIDFSSSEAIPAASASYSVSGGASGETVSGLLRFFTHAADGGRPTQMTIWDGGSSTQVTGTYVAVPASLLTTGDVQDFLWSANATGGTTASWRSIMDVFATASNRTLSFGPALNTPTFSQVTASAGVRFRVQLPAQAEYSGRAVFGFSQSGSNVMSIEISASYLDGAPPTWDVTVPDFSGAPGFDGSWLLQPGKSTSTQAEAWSVSAIPLSHRRAIPPNTTARYAGNRVTGVMPTLRAP